LKKAKIDVGKQNNGLHYFEEQLHAAYKNYHQAKANDGPLRETALHTLAEAHAAANNTTKQQALKTLIHHEAQKRTAKKIKYVRGKIIIGSTSVVSVQNAEGDWKDVTAKEDIE
jgi:hypothetical protein